MSELIKEKGSLVMSNLKSRLSRHFVACATVAAAATGAAEAGIVWSGIVNLTIPASTNGLYVNVITGQNNLPPPGSGGNTVPGWDINPWGSTGFGLFSPAGGGYLNLGANLFNLPGGTSIGPGGTFGSLSTATNNAQWNLNSSNNIVGFRFVAEGGNTTHYGWFRVAFGSTITSRTLVEYAYESDANTAINAGVIPAPGALALLGLGGLLGARRRRA